MSFSNGYDYNDSTSYGDNAEYNNDSEPETENEVEAEPETEAESKKPAKRKRTPRAAKDRYAKNVVGSVIETVDDVRGWNEDEFTLAADSLNLSASSRTETDMVVAILGGRAKELTDVAEALVSLGDEGANDMARMAVLYGATDDVRAALWRVFEVAGAVSGSRPGESLGVAMGVVSGLSENEDTAVLLGERALAILEAVS